MDIINSIKTHELRQSAIDKLHDLVAFKTVSRDSNLELIEYFENYCKNFGAITKRIYNAENTKANLIVGFAPQNDGAIVLSGHSDVVPIEDQDWDSDPFSILIKDNKIYGRGTSDMKAFSACFLALVPKIASSNLVRPIYFALSYDEEIGCLGAPTMVDDLAQNFGQIDAVIVGEPTNMKVVSAHKLINTFKVEITGLEGHSSRPDLGVSAIMEAIPIMEYISDLNQEYSKPNGIFELNGASLTIGVIEGGTAGNILAHHCRFLFDIRCEPDFDIEIIVQKIAAKVDQIDTNIKKRAPNGGAKLVRRSNTPGLRFEPNSKAEQLSRQITGDNDIMGVAYAAEAGLFQNAGMAAIICGPGSIAQAHQPNEFIEIAEIDKCLFFLDRIISKQI
jgi:acetylornithine deacetylase